MRSIVHLGRSIARTAAQYAILTAERLVRGRPPSGDFTAIRSFLFLQYEQALGSAIHATPAIEAVKSAFPAATIVVATSGMALEVLRQNPFIDRLIPTPDPYNHLRSCSAVLREAFSRIEQPACIVTTHGSSRSRMALLAVLAGKAIRAGYSLAPLLYDKLAVYDPSESLIRNNLRLIEVLGAPYRHYEPRVWFSSDDLAFAQSLLEKSGLNGGRPIAILVTQTSEGQPKKWRDDRFASIAAYLIDKYGYHIVFVGTAKEARSIEGIRKILNRRSVSLAGETSVSQLSAIMSLSDLAVAVDTGTMHIGRAVQLPMAVIVPAWQPVIEWLPVGSDRVEILQSKNMLAASADYIIDEITVSQVITAVDRLIAKYPAALAARARRIEMSLNTTA